MIQQQLVTLNDILHLTKAAYIDGYVQALRDLKDGKVNPIAILDRAEESLAHSSKTYNHMIKAWETHAVLPLTFDLDGLDEFVRKAQGD